MKPMKNILIEKNRKMKATFYTVIITEPQKPCHYFVTLTTETFGNDIF